MATKRCLIVILTFLISISTAFAQGDGSLVPANPDDPGYDPNGCNLPLDTWVYVLVIAAVIFGAYKLHQKQKALTV
jgi:hypothetical protein